MDRIALVIGNSDYSNVGKLNNPKNDADDIASMNITVRQSRQSGVARATCPD